MGNESCRVCNAIQYPLFNIFISNHDENICFCNAKIMPKQFNIHIVNKYIYYYQFPYTIVIIIIQL